MKHSGITSPLALGGAATMGLFDNALWAFLAAFAILAALTAIARIVPRRGALPRPASPSGRRYRGAHAGPGRFARIGFQVRR